MSTLEMVPAVRPEWTITSDPTKPAASLLGHVHPFHDAKLGELRDAGIDFNNSVPLNVHLGCDVILIMDASGGVKGCEELKKAVDRKHVRVRDDELKLLSRPYGPKEVC